jgi:hypothetical protein
MKHNITNSTNLKFVWGIDSQVVKHCLPDQPLANWINSRHIGGRHRLCSGFTYGMHHYVLEGGNLSRRFMCW